MGISEAFGVVGFTFFFAAVCLKDSSFKLIPLSLLYSSFIASLVLVASLPVKNFPLILGKASNGKFPLWSKILYFPFFFLVLLYVFLKRLKRREPIYNEISEGFFVGGWPSSKKHLPPGDPAVIDCTCELPRSSFISEDSYLCVATWDTRAPLPTEIETAVRWASKMRAQKKPIYVHCAFGHGRSVCVMCAVLVTLGVAEDWKAAEKLVREKRPKIRMNVLHRKHLEEWSKLTHFSNGEHNDPLSATSGAFVQQ
ncbi:uncharacterized protein LOC110025284 isoform X2 [Phalaenopsis equestris]|uniref:uncharacterized protein LOC110025284 isoform X2 n=1 Tax=Phalaenopsis equestris TaxID=78828 RepID=UPI0009E1C9A7|nr:uncharacterized protein LOC110025284 isoform X2 [Phalaenopsis equestris]